MTAARLVPAAWVLCMALGCSDSREPTPQDAIYVGALLPFTGQEAAIGFNLEQALLLAEEDINRAGGVDGRPFHIISRNSYSGSARGLDELLGLLYVHKVAYLIGPEENQLALEIVRDIKALDVFNILPGYSAPPIERVGRTGAWLRLAPSPAEVGCALAKQLRIEGAQSANAVVTRDDYNTTLAAQFNAEFGHSGGTARPSVTVRPGAGSYATALDTAFGYGADQTLLMAYPTTAATIATDWAVTDGRGAWHLTPALHAEVFLQNVPYRALDGFRGLSPSLSLPGECDMEHAEESGRVDCTRSNAESFVQHFAHRWDGEPPFPAAHFYYDAVVLLAMGLQYGVARYGHWPSAAELRDSTLELSASDNGTVDWHHLGQAMAELGDGRAARYVGAAAEYDFDRYGAAQHVIFDTWRISKHRFVDSGPLVASCPRNL
ncbi:MAG: ABC transporter substrate-binding protein [Polyangiaceae bacterium]|nr:ABC transporter substrate-binding protein [Polyangiaceae bacterium]